MNLFKEGQEVKIIGDQTSHGLPIGSIQKIDFVGSMLGLPYYVILDKTQTQPARHVTTEDIQPLGMLIA